MIVMVIFNEACGSPNSPSPNFSSASQVMSGKTRTNSVYNAFVGFLLSHSSLLSSQLSPNANLSVTTGK